MKSNATLLSTASIQRRRTGKRIRNNPKMNASFTNSCSADPTWLLSTKPLIGIADSRIKISQDCNGYSVAWETYWRIFNVRRPPTRVVHQGAGTHRPRDCSEWLVWVRLTSPKSKRASAAVVQSHIPVELFGVAGNLVYDTGFPLSEETAGNPGSNPGGRTILRVNLYRSTNPLFLLAF